MGCKLMHVQISIENTTLTFLAKVRNRNSNDIKLETGRDGGSEGAEHDFAASQRDREG